MKQKYIVIYASGEELIFTFPDIVAHNHMLNSIRQISEGIRDSRIKPYAASELRSAGFVTNDGICYGKSESLNVCSRLGIDTMLLNIGRMK